ncbi:MAG: 6-hydroxycyclohex-1-ene-1-carbonyl-CoA dehydrogenase [Antarcticimicrobium sp.]|uniref:6-hydroxycyclohex-1-ene-1-carbonyl-CoA dehydrogenase n=1 Tax=Antarcticimicrobium sp. TaxID=2824147 RepID=UPI00262E8982|nr:6-hydroxycyclohex-1-ene-1-carbonyl-CoA dehydrogenase [Antarcticimicrobium sp.]MDF1717755.1 6-hydroxycyclohex-1-ene-1-carbonyl-CoA dehydrogenase [Antarcticimicrobium sp.]
MARRWMMVSGEKPMVREEFQPDAPGPGEVVVEIAGCGVCHTDLGFYFDGVRTNQPLPLCLGHEISGIVTQAGEAAGDWIGKPVIIPAVIPCGECDACQRGKGTICRAQKMPGNDIQGGFATHITVPARGLCPVDMDRLTAVGLTLADVSVVADALTTPYQAAVQAGIGPGDLVIVNGTGGVGGYAVQVAAAMGATVVAIDVVQEKLAAVQGHGAALALNARDFDSRGLKQEIIGFAKANGLKTSEWIIMECSGTAAGQTAAFGLLNHGATMCVVGFTMDKVEVRLSNLMALHARLLGNWGCPPELYPGALELVLSGKVKLAPFIEQRPLDDINAVFRDVHDGKLVRRQILVPGS